MANEETNANNQKSEVATQTSLAPNTLVIISQHILMSLDAAQGRAAQVRQAVVLGDDDRVFLIVRIAADVGHNAQATAGLGQDLVAEEHVAVVGGGEVDAVGQDVNPRQLSKRSAPRRLRAPPPQNLCVMCGTDSIAWAENKHMAQTRRDNSPPV